MRAATTVHLHPSACSSAIAAAAFAKNHTTSVASLFSSMSCCRICRCSTDNTDPLRAWAVLKESRTGPCSAWFHTTLDKVFPGAAAAAAAASSQGSKNLEGDTENGGESEQGWSAGLGSEEKPLKLHRRQKGSLTAAALLGNPDLLAIPGVGPRNLRKLMEKGIAGVVELKKLYKDKVFVRAVHEANWMNEMEISIYDSWFDPVVSCLPGLIPDGFIYLRASPDTCHKRMLLRKRAEEGGVSLEYLHDLHEKHESWLFPFQSGNQGVFSVSMIATNMDCSLHPDIRDRVFYLEGDHMHSSIQKVPTLVLDCEPNIDFSKDIEAKREYARQVAEFFEFVKKKNKDPAHKAGEAGKSSQVPLPHKDGMWVPAGKHFPKSALKSLDFRRAMSFMS